jgi:hypothetical protein
MFLYQQLCGALGSLKIFGVPLDWGEIEQELRQMCKQYPPDQDMVRKMHRKYRDMALECGIIGRGELFCENDCVPLVD